GQDSVRRGDAWIVALEEEVLGVALGVRVHQYRAAGSPVTPRASDFLVVRFQAARQSRVDHGADVSFVARHAKGNGRHHNLDPTLEELFLDSLATRASSRA